MEMAKLLESPYCAHRTKTEQCGLALITIGNSLRGDDGVATALCDALPTNAIDNVCRFDLGSHTSLIGDCLTGHKAAIIIDSTCNGTDPGTVTILDLSLLVERTSPLNIGSCHGLSVADELRLAKRVHKLPKRMIFFGVEISDVSWAERISSPLERKLPQVASKLSVLVQAIVEILKRDA